MFRRFFTLFLSLPLLLGLALPCDAAELQLSGVRLDPCSEQDPGNQPDLSRPVGASCYVLTGDVENSSRDSVVDTDVYARILDASGEPVLPNRTRVGSIGDVNPGQSQFALRISVPSGTPGPFEIKNVRARGFKAPVRTRVDADDDDLLPLERGINLDSLPG
ncbi:hypothetical protein [Synechococcus sp. MU1625]|uniref:hypothetical protein n=1 Tax=Synechococcus sp. MU1625 TaxID=2508347 RepID=UPI001CF80A21|nr:hypothetical protein [Synechococcus sp. MU1625]MCB4398990.1 hypothetical protein [Synechococcus sp. MU1625]